MLWAKTRASPKGLQPESALAALLVLAIERLLPSPGALPSPILAATHTCFTMLGTLTRKRGQALAIFSPQLIVTLPASTPLRASLRRCNALVPPRFGGNRENEMEMQKQAMGTTPIGIASEMFALALHALVAGVAAAIVAGSL